MNRTYDLFEKINGHMLWRGSVTGLEAGRKMVLDLAKQTGNECLLMHVLTREVMERVTANGDKS